MSYYQSYLIDDEVRANREINKQETLLLQELPRHESISKLINDNYSILSDFEPGKMTYVIKSKTLEEPVVIKMRQKFFPQDGSDFNEVTHEAFIGLMGTNTLNSNNFARILLANPDETCLEKFYDPTSYKIPYKRVERDIIKQSKINCSYVVYEYIPGMTLRDFILTTNSVQNLKSIYWEIFQALYEANKKIDFTHYDLHPLNVIVKDDGTPVIIDYGSSHIKYEEKDYGREFSQAKIINRSRWYHDVVKLLWHALNLTDKPIMFQRFSNRIRDFPKYRNDSEERMEKIFSLVDDELTSINHTGDFITLTFDDMPLTFYGLVFPKTKFAFGPIVRKLLAFFGLNDITLEEFNEAKKDFFHPSVEIVERNPSFDDFMAYAESLLT